MIKGVHHIAYLVKDLDAASHLFTKVLGGSLIKRNYFEPSGVEVALIDLGNVIFELVFPVRQGTESWRTMQEKGPGFYHMAFLVDGIPSTLAELEAGGVQLVDRQAIPGVDWDVAWLEAGSMLGVKSQLVKPREDKPE